MSSVLHDLTVDLVDEINDLEIIDKEQAQLLGKIFLAIHNKCGRAWIENCLHQIDTMAVDSVRAVQSIQMEIERGSADRSA